LAFLATWYVESVPSFFLKEGTVQLKKILMIPALIVSGQRAHSYAILTFLSFLSGKISLLRKKMLGDLRRDLAAKIIASGMKCNSRGILRYERVFTRQKITSKIPEVLCSQNN